MVKIVKFIYFVSLFVIGVCSMKLYGMRSHKKKHLVEAVKNALRDD